MYLLRFGVPSLHSYIHDMTYSSTTLGYLGTYYAYLVSYTVQRTETTSTTNHKVEFGGI